MEARARDMVFCVIIKGRWANSGVRESEPFCVVERETGAALPEESVEGVLGDTQDRKSERLMVVEGTENCVISGSGSSNTCGTGGWRLPGA